MQREENAKSIRHLLNHDSYFVHVDSFRRMKRTSFTVSDQYLDGSDKMQAKRFIPERAYLSSLLLEDPPSVLFFLFKKKGA